MNLPVHPYEDEIDLVELVTTLWSEKIVITVFLVIATLLGGLYILVSKVEYEIRLDYDIDTAPLSNGGTGSYRHKQKIF